MKISLVVIGDEILLGQVTDTNSGEIARTVSVANWTVSRVFIVGDDAEEIKYAINAALEASDVVITTGGLGPTKDDITKSVLLDIFGGKLIQNEDVLRNVEDVCRWRHIVLNDLTRTQALVPSTARIIQNKVGTAPIMWFEKKCGDKGKVLVTMPGVPFETSQMMREEVFPQLLSRFGSDVTVAHRYLLVYGVIESKIAEMLDEWEKALPTNLHLAYLPVPGYVKLRLDGIDKDGASINALLDEKKAQIESILGDAIFADENKTITEILIDRLKAKGYTMATAESCTGGNIAHSVTMVAGASEVYYGSVVSYANDVKIRVLGVDENVINTLGAVSEPVAIQMAKGVAKVINTDCSVATSGIAGPGGGTPEKPVGTVCIAVHTPQKDLVGTYFLPGNRGRVIDRATTTALIELIRML